MEINRKRVNIRLVNNEKSLKNVRHFYHLTVFDENLTAVHMKNKVVI